MFQKFIKTVLLLLTLHLSWGLYAQTVEDLSDEEIKIFLQQALATGLTEEQLIAAAALKGYTPSDIAKFRDRALLIEKKSNNIKPSLTIATDSSAKDSVKKDNRRKNIDKVAESKRLKIFGLNIFNNQTLNFEPNLNIATPRNYILGANDELSIDITGYAYAHYDVKVNTEGNIKIENLNPIFVAGQTLEQAKIKIVERLKSIYGGLAKGGLSADVTLSKIRSIKVTVIGETVYPGAYTVPSLATAFNVLYAAGGPSDIGSLRNIEVFRKGKKVRTLDLYDFLLKGDLSNDIVLMDQDVVLIPYVDKRVTVSGAVRNPKIFELKDGDFLSSVINFSGGFNEQAYTKAIKINRVTETEKKIITVQNGNFSNFILHKGDNITIDSLLDRYENKVTVSGAIFRPGDYELEPQMNLKKLIERAEGLKPEAYHERVLLFREKENADVEVIPLDLRKVFDGSIPDFQLLKNDSLVIKSYEDLREKRTIQLDGEINNPSILPFMDNLSVSDAIMLAGGFKDGANPSRIEIARRVKSDGVDGDQNIQILKIDINPQLGILENDKSLVLQPFDRIYVRKMSQYEQQKTVTISGEVNYPGPYTLQDKKERISDLIIKAGGLKGEADLGSAHFVRDGIQMGVDLKRVLDNTSDVQNLLLNKGDYLDIPRKKETVTISGQVYNPITVPFQEGLGLLDYLDLAGGITDSAHVKKTYVKYGNGRLNKSHTTLGYRSFPKIESGSEIIVPLYMKQRWTPAERIAVSSAVVSVATVLLTVVLRAFQ